MSADESRQDVPAESDLIFDWNTREPHSRPARVEFDDETLRDGLQSPSARDPDIDDKLRILHLMADLGIDSADLGLPGAPRASAPTSSAWRKRSATRSWISCRTAPPAR